MTTKEKKTGRPTDYNETLGREICTRIASGESLRKITKDLHMPCTATVFNWLLHPENKAFLEQYEAARNIQAELLFEELLEISDNTEEGVETTERGEQVETKKGDMLGHRRLKIDARKWYLSKVLPKKFGDKVDLTSDGKAIKGNTIIFTDFTDEANSQ